MLESWGSPKAAEMLAFMTEDTGEMRRFTATLAFIFIQGSDTETSSIASRQEWITSTDRRQTKVEK